MLESHGKNTMKGKLMISTDSKFIILGIFLGGLAGLAGIGIAYLLAH